MKEFKWQYSDEKILFKAKENLVSFILRKFWVIFSFMILILIISLILLFLDYVFLAYILVFVSIFLIVFYYWFLYKDSFLYFTTRRIIKQIRNGIFFRHRKELKIMDIKSSMSNKKGLMQTALRVWNIKIEWTEKEGSIYFSGIKEYAEVSNYIWRVIDYVKLNGHSDNIARYQDKKMRKNK